MNATTKTTKKIASTAAVMPIVSSSKKMIFLKTAAANGARSVAATINALETGKLTNLNADLKAFVKEHGDAKVWTSRIATIQPQKLARSVERQVAFWKDNGYTVVNAIAA